MAIPSSTDVLIIGAGPVGLLIALGLAQQGVKTVLIEKRSRSTQATFGRATTLYPRSIELLEQLQIAKDFCQAGYVSRNAVNYKDGVRVNDRGWQAMFEPFRNSFHDYALSIRQKNSEELIISKYQTTGEVVQFGCSLEGYELDSDDAQKDGCKVTALLKDAEGETKQIRCKYLVGADGGSSTVRKIANIAMIGSHTMYQWIRIDGKMNTNMPDADIGFAAVESRYHGNVLWVKLDQDAHRIGFAVTESLLAKYPDGLTKEDAVEEAKAAMSPFSLDIERLDWWTQYKIRQTVAETLQTNQFVLLAGDAAHTHSSGFAQGMNTGIHDATNLVWKLAGTIKGWYQPEVLESYSLERHAAAEHLIRIDRDAASLITGDIPPAYNSLGMSADALLSKVMVDNMNFTSGLGVKYGASFLNNPLLNTTVTTGTRAPDALVRAPGPNISLRLQEAVLHAEPVGSWTILVFGGYHTTTSALVSALGVKLKCAIKERTQMIRLATIIASPVGSAWAAFGGPAPGHLYFDFDGSAHSRYGVSLSSGAVVVIRPDGIIGYATGLDGGDGVAAYLTKVFL